MKTLILMLSTLLVVGCCAKTTHETRQETEPADSVQKDLPAEIAQKITPAEKNLVDYDPLIDNYLRTRRVEPTLILNTKGKSLFDVLGHKISWAYNEKKNAVTITIDGKHITTKGKITLNPVDGNAGRNVDFTNYVEQIKVYELYNDYNKDTLNNTIIGFLLTPKPCTGTGCGVNYQLLYDMKTGQESYFGRYRTGFDLELYAYNKESEIDYLSKSYDWNQATMRETIKYVIYSRAEDGKFKIFRDAQGKPYSFEHNYSYDHIYSDVDTLPQTFKEHWIEKIIKPKRKNN